MSSGKLQANKFPCKGTAAENPQTALDNKAINEAVDPAVELPWAGGSTRTTSGRKKKKTDESNAYGKVDIGSKQSPWP